MVDVGDAAIPKKRGRPRKERPPEQMQQYPPMQLLLAGTAAAATAVLQPGNVPKKRGRPRKLVVPVPPHSPDLDAPAQLDVDDFSLSNVNDAASSTMSVPSPEQQQINYNVAAEGVAKKNRVRSFKFSLRPALPQYRASSASPVQAEFESICLQASASADGNDDNAATDDNNSTGVQEGMHADNHHHPSNTTAKQLDDGQEKEQLHFSPTQDQMAELLFFDDGHHGDNNNDSTAQNQHHYQNHDAAATSVKKRGRPLPTSTKGTATAPLAILQQQQQQQQNSDDVSDAPSSPPPFKRVRTKGTGSRPASRCVCTWGEECARFRRFFERIKEKEGECIFAGTFRPAIGGGERQANFLDAVDRHLSTSQEVRQRTSGRYVIAFHHFPVNVLEHVKKLNSRSFLLPVSNEVAIELGLTSDPADEYQTHCEPDEYGRLRPVRGDMDSTDATDESEDEEKQWVLAPCHEYSDVKAIVDEGIAREIEKRIQEKREEKRKRQQEDEPDEMETNGNNHKDDEEKNARIAELEEEVAGKNARIEELEEALVDAKESNQLLQCQLRSVIQQIKD